MSAEHSIGEEHRQDTRFFTANMVYTHLTVNLTEEGLVCLERKGCVRGEIFYTSRDGNAWLLLKVALDPLAADTTATRVRVDGEVTSAFEVVLCSRHFDLVKGGREVGFNHTNRGVTLREVFIRPPNFMY
ncbi:MAG: hypothetical protein A2700_02775 [Candidatus Blackburnbacteria bacterium RIFCSPHIGHO2_01_FULL_44_64]|uniref:Uncharacterized protein n=1 Tax=Candidatus Blackburnbacteria bacterium RIFCSPHIGHO2_02_FULL_44_20 TaxID=1797516 RepID=A0A1G1V414_9BACT|nr:MAG: hypothetical protein A2700_02775 [Candidatus Blackburnbacteria bacterium RIFCSPHIGHO2_01_FULL_44_64]OGY10120.1 MAG: hypothetical protein A3D26_00845 [Candidatus Blackburnbacteria bacterium RIFCSPHIGHO2_02_FULL_44_20]OGY10630.1 MAG: hypothetical protein A3E16_02300 [Candidatus Blackburnbacteria bacterium RIFCSPHIGHO2_12_FULL_44_25]OGY15319.1 MAG: hypothetical protein A3A62_01535 [Candidatus Blackburnbacteria bacterium RIFCSPLOWO2_01_FULL_44_43]OGY15470.1 MAG: hypothetical protein A3H88_0